MSDSFVEGDGDAPKWNAHNGGPVPVYLTAVVVVRYRCGVLSVVEAGKRRWQSWPVEIGLSDWDIVAWRPATRRDL